jgi:hypothetical protein
VVAAPHTEGVLQQQEHFARVKVVLRGLPAGGEFIKKLVNHYLHFIFFTRIFL